MQTFFVTFRCAQYTIQLHFITNSNDFNFFIHYIKLTSKKLKNLSYPLIIYGPSLRQKSSKIIKLIIKTLFLKTKLSPIYPKMSCFKSGKSGRNFRRNFCPNPVNPVPAGFENSKSGAPLVSRLACDG